MDQDERNAYQLAHMADCGEPDTRESAGAEWLATVASVAAENIDELESPFADVASLWGIDDVGREYVREVVADLVAELDA